MSVRKNLSGMRSLSGFGSNQFPVWVTRTDVACEGPDISNVGHFFRIAIDRFAMRDYWLGLARPAMGPADDRHVRHVPDPVERTVRRLPIQGIVRDTVDRIGP